MKNMKRFITHSLSQSSHRRAGLVWFWIQQKSVVLTEECLSFLFSSCVAQHQYFSPISTKRGSPQPQLKYVRIIWHWIYIFWCSKSKTAGMPHPKHGDVQSRPGQTNPTGQMSPNRSYAKPNQLAECWLCCMIFLIQCCHNMGVNT